MDDFPIPSAPAKNSLFRLHPYRPRLCLGAQLLQAELLILLVGSDQSRGSAGRNTCLILFGVFSLGDLEVQAHAGFGDEMAAFVNELRRQGWRDVDRTNFRGSIQVITFTRR